MNLSLDRRSLLAGAAALGASGLAPTGGAQAAGGWETLVAAARSRAALPYVGGRAAFAAFRRGEAVFLADEFRAPGDPGRFGAAARIFAVGLGVDGLGERPTFRELRREGDTLLALLDCPSICAATRLRLAEGGCDMRVEARLFFRRAVGTLAMAPCTALVQPPGRDAVREADALLVSASAGDFEIRPGPPPQPSLREVVVTAGLKSFGLVLSPGTAPVGGRLPGLRVTPAEDWGPGEVALAEAPAAGEFHDNVATAFVPRRTFAAGDAFAYRYALAWSAAEPARIA